MNKILIIIIFFFLFTENGYTADKQKLINSFSKIQNIKFNFIQTIAGKDENGKCTIKYPKKIYCEYEKKNNKILVSNGRSLVIKTNNAHYRYNIKSTPFEFLLDKEFLISKIKLSELNEYDGKYIFFKIIENNNNISIFFGKENYEIIGWQIEDMYQNLAITYIFNTSINQDIDEKIFKLPKTY